MKILIIEDEPSLREVMTRTLEGEGYVVETAGDAAMAREKIGIYDYDCILLDIMLPDGNGLDVLRELKECHKSDSVIIISARDSIDDKVDGLELGADDYLPKPFHLAELVARIRSVVRRRYHSGGVSVEMANLRVAPDKRRVWVDERELTLSRKEYDILLFFVNRHDHLISKEALAEAVWGDNIDQCDNYDFVYAQLKNLRRKLEEAGASVELKTIYGFGYKMTLQQ